jgi:glycosyltransferase involved in cell wall biosynthesis
MHKRILMMSSIPFAAPWNGADKNFGRLIAHTDSQNIYIVQTGLEDDWPAHVKSVFARHPGAMPTNREKLRAFVYLLRHTSQADIVHIVASLSNPSRLATTFLKAWHKTARKPVVHTIPSLGDRPVDPRNFFADVTVVVSEDSRRKLEAQGVRNVQRVWPPLDIRQLRPKQPPEQVAANLALGPRAILYPAHYGPDSGIQEIIQAFAQLPPSLADSVLVLACRTTPEQDSEDEAQRATAWAQAAGVAERVRVLGNVEDMPALISACAITVLVPRKLASKMDLPLVILESLALRRPVIVTDRAPMREALLGGGLAVPFGDIAALSTAIDQLLSDPALRRRLAARGEEAVREACDPQRVVEQFRTIYQSLDVR